MVDENANTDPNANVNAQETESNERPTEPGKPGDIKNGYRWDSATNSWVRHAGIDFSKDQSRLPHGFQHSGNGTPESPHRVEIASRWS